MIDVGVVAGFDDSSLPDGQGRFFDDGAFQKIGKFTEIFDLLIEPGQAACRFVFCSFLRRFLRCRRIPANKGTEDSFDRDKHAKRVTQSDQISGVGGAIGNAGHETLEIIDGAQVFSHFIPVYALLAEGLYAVQPLLDLCPLGERLFQEAVQEAGAHCRTGLVKDP